LDEEQSVFTIHKRNEQDPDRNENDSITTAVQGEGANLVDLTDGKNSKSVDMME
jgi:hypothetical protein